VPAVGGRPAVEEGRHLFDGKGAVRGQKEEAARRVDGVPKKADRGGAVPYALLGVDAQPQAPEEALDRAECVDRLGLRRRMATSRRGGAAKIVDVGDHPKSFAT